MLTRSHSLTFSSLIDESIMSAFDPLCDPENDLNAQARDDLIWFSPSKVETLEYSCGTNPTKSATKSLTKVVVKQRAKTEDMISF